MRKIKKMENEVNIRLREKMEEVKAKKDEVH